MNSLNIVSRLTSTPPPSPPRSRTSSITPDQADSIKKEQDDQCQTTESTSHGPEHEVKSEPCGDGSNDEKMPLLAKEKEAANKSTASKNFIWQLPSRITDAVVYSVKLVLSTLAAPGHYVVACFYDEQGHFSAVMPLKKFRSLFSRDRRKHATPEASFAIREKAELQRDSSRMRRKGGHHARSPSVESTASTVSMGSSENESAAEDSPSRHTRSKSSEGSPSEGTTSTRRPGRVKLLDNDQALRNRQKGRVRSPSAADADDFNTIATALKSPSLGSNSSKVTRYPRTPAPPRPLVPRRQPSYSLSYSPDAPKKTLIIDLDETLIHSMARGGRMSTGHMVEVRLGGPVSASGIQLGPGVPILYYVHERPGCHEFLRKVCKWFNLVIFTASVQEYADPVIDWLERERKYFSGRYYRQHCTYRNGAYIKDLAQVEPDLSKVMILDNSPMSYIFHEDNAIPIEGWISDPTDNDLLFLIPLLEGLQYVTDVRALLALRHGQAQQA